ncbi:MAG: hypothetical protein PHS56_04550, partial [Eubacteriales bacterium]|nr:hypothetical protein [Eubacteriales bacterium]
MVKIIFQKRRRIRIDANNPYKTREMIFNLVDQGTKFNIEVEQYDYVMRSLVAEDKIITPELENQATARQLIEYMLKNVRDTGEVIDIYYDWRKGKVPLI